MRIVEYTGKSNRFKAAAEMAQLGFPKASGKISIS
jgi:hypothetical protein